MDIIWIAVKPYVEDDRYWNGLRPLTPRELEQMGYHMTEFIKGSVKWGDLKKKLKVVKVNGQQVVIDENGQVVPGVVVKPESIIYGVEVE